MKLVVVLLALALIAVLAKSMFFSFRAQDPADYRSTGPTFDPDNHLSGDILSEGVIFGPDGKLASRFVARMRGEWTSDSGTLTEEFTYATGRTQSRKWVMTRTGETTLTATADDIVGEARGVLSGATLRLEYTIVLPEDAGGHRLDVIDWLYLMDNGVIMNKSEMRKFGVKVAELVATMRPADSEGRASE